MKIFTAIVFCFLLSVQPIFAVGEQNDAEDSEIDIKETLFGHVGNDYEFHIAKIRGKDITLPLPVILYGKDKGLCIFMSSRFNHKSQSYKGFKIAEEGDCKGLAVEYADDGSELRPLDLSITKNVFTIFIACLLISLVFIGIGKKYKRKPLSAPSRLQSIMEPIILFIVDDVAKPVLGHSYKKYIHYLLTVFFTILTLNLIGLIPVFPFGGNVTGNINVTLALALCTLILTMFGTTKNYWNHKLWTPGVPGWVKVSSLMPFVEVISIFTGPIALTIRLLANILSGHMIVIVMTSMIFIFYAYGPVVETPVTLVSLAFSLFILMLDVLVAFVQAYVFTLLSALYFAGAKH